MNNDLILKAVAFLSLTITLTACTGTQSREPFSRPGDLVDIGTHSLHLYCRGHGQPTIVLESGAGIGSSEWVRVQGELAQYTRVCSYDRAGLVWSEKRSASHTAETVATELHTLLNAASEGGAVILVGHSLGGIYVRKYAERYPDKILGLVLVDSSHPDQESKGMGLFGLPLIKSAVIAFTRVSGMADRAMRNALVTAPEDVKELNAAFAAYSLPAIMAELDKVPLILREVEGRGSLGDLPLIVIRADLQYKPDYGLNVQQDPERLAEQYQTHKRLQEDLLYLSSNARLLVAEGSGHNVPFEEPEIIIQAVAEILAELE